MLMKGVPVQLQAPLQNPPGKELKMKQTEERRIRDVLPNFWEMIDRIKAFLQGGPNGKKLPDEKTSQPEHSMTSSMEKGPVVPAICRGEQGTEPNEALERLGIAVEQAPGTEQKRRDTLQKTKAPDVQVTKEAAGIDVVTDELDKSAKPSESDEPAEHRKPKALDLGASGRARAVEKRQTGNTEQADKTERVKHAASVAVESSARPTVTIAPPKPHSQPVQPPRPTPVSERKPARPAAKEMVFQMMNVSKQYGSGDNGVNALSNVNLSIPKGEMVGVIGVSGSGKTTLLNILGGVDRPDSGVVLYRGRPMKFDEKYLNKYRLWHVGWVFQELNLVSHLKVWKNVALPLVLRGKTWKEARERALDILTRLGLEDKCNVYPSQLAGGQKQRVAIAMALAKKARVILADEPTGNLDEKTGRNVMNLIGMCCIKRGTSVIVVTHDKDLADEYCRHIYRFTDTGYIERIK